MSEPLEQTVFSLGEAAKATGLSKAAIAKALKTGRLSARDRTEGGQYQIDASELFRAFPRKASQPVDSKPESQVNDGIPQRLTGFTDEAAILKIKLEALETQMAEKEARLRDKDDVIDDLRSRLDRAEEERSRVTRILTNQTERQAEAAAEPSKPEAITEQRKGWRRLFSR